MMNARDDLPNIRSDDEMLDAVGRGERITQSELERIMLGWRGEMLPKDDGAYYVSRPTRAPEPTFDVVAWLLRVVVVLNIVSIIMVLTGIAWAAAVTAGCVIGVVFGVWLHRKVYQL